MTAHDVARLLPDVPVLRDLCRSMAVLEAILSPDWEGRYHCFDAAWGPLEEIASIRNGSGDEYSIIFSAEGAYIRGFDHEAAIGPYGNDGPWPGDGWSVTVNDARTLTPYRRLKVDPLALMLVTGCR